MRESPISRHRVCCVSEEESDDEFMYSGTEEGTSEEDVQR